MNATATGSSMSKRPGRQPTKLIDPMLTFDPGPSWKQKTDGTLLSRGPGRAILRDREDIEAAGDTRGAKPVIRGAERRYNSLEELLTRGTITKRQHDAATRFLDDCSLASGGGGTANLSGIPTSPSPRSGLPERQVQAIGSVHAVIRLLGLNSGTVFWRVVFDDKSLNDCDAEDKVQHGTSGRLLKLALTALDEWYNGKNRRRDE